MVELMLRSRKGQVGIEYMVLAGVLLLAVGAIFGYSLLTSQSAIRFDKTRNAVQSLARCADQAHALGAGSKIYVEIDLPENITGFVLSGQVIKYYLLDHIILHILHKLDYMEESQLNSQLI